MIANALMKNPVYRFAINKMKTSELFNCFANENEISQRIASDHIEDIIRFSIEFIPPHPPEKHVNDEAIPNKNEADNTEAIIKAAITVNINNRQTVPSFFTPSKINVLSLDSEHFR